MVHHSPKWDTVYPWHKNKDKGNWCMVTITWSIKLFSLTYRACIMALFVKLHTNGGYWEQWRIKRSNWRPWMTVWRTWNKNLVSNRSHFFIGSLIARWVSPTNFQHFSVIKRINNNGPVWLASCCMTISVTSATQQSTHPPPINLFQVKVCCKYCLLPTKGSSMLTTSPLIHYHALSRWPT